jgi:hypothetical protein
VCGSRKVFKLDVIMLSSSYLRAFLCRLPKDFRLIINGATHPCNRQNLFAFSSVIRSANPSVPEFHLDVPIPPEVASSVVAFLHGGALDLPECRVFDCFFLVAAPGIDVLRKRLMVGAFRTLTTANIEERFRLLRPFPDSFQPILMFLDNSPRLFNNFFSANLFPPEFIRAVLFQTVNVFPSEDDRFTFLKAYVTASDDPDFSLFRSIHLERLTLSMLPAVFDTEEIPRHCRTFPLIAALISQRKRLAALQRDAALDVDRLRREKATFEPKAAAPIFVDSTAGVEEKVRQIFQRIGADLCSTAACISLLAIGDERACEFVGRITNLKAMSGEMAKMFVEFQRDGGWLLYPGSSKTSIQVTISWEATVSQLQKLTMNFAPNQVAAETSARNVLSIAQSLIKGGIATQDVKRGARTSKQ